MAPTRRGARQTERRDVEYALELRVGEALVSHRCRVPWDKTPRIGQRLPVVLPGGDAARVRVAWDRAPSLTASMLAAGDAARRGDAAGTADALGFTLRQG